MMWIDINLESPPKGVPVLVYLSEGTRTDLSNGGRIAIDERRNRKGIEFFCYYPHNITHWMMLPAPPAAIIGKEAVE